jgi:hypothetical protein
VKHLDVTGLSNRLAVRGISDIDDSHISDFTTLTRLA